MPMSTAQTVAMSTDDADLEASGDSSNGSDFDFKDDDDEDDDDYYGEYDASGSGDGGRFWFPETRFGLNSFCWDVKRVFYSFSSSETESDPWLKVRTVPCLGSVMF